MTLLELLGQEKYDKLKAALGDGFSAFEESFNSGTITEADVTAKMTELGIDATSTDTTSQTDTTDTTATDTSTGTEPTSTDTSTTENPTTDTATNPDTGTVPTDTGTTDSSTEFVEVLADGWLKPDGGVDLDKILDPNLKSYIQGLQSALEKADWDSKFTLAILSEALIEGMQNTDDANTFINRSDLSIDANGKVIGVKEAFAKLRQERPYLFKQPTAPENNPVSNGFNPVNNIASQKPTSLAEAEAQTRAMYPSGY